MWGVSHKSVQAIDLFYFALVSLFAYALEFIQDRRVAIIGAHKKAPVSSSSFSIWVRRFDNHYTVQCSRNLPLTKSRVEVWTPKLWWQASALEFAANVLIMSASNWSANAIIANASLPASPGPHAWNMKQLQGGRRRGNEAHFKQSKDAFSAFATLTQFSSAGWAKVQYHTNGQMQCTSSP